MHQTAECTTAEHELVYLGFRVALLDLTDGLAATSPRVSNCTFDGFLNEMQWMHGVPLHVQMSLLAGTWRTLQDPGQTFSVRDQCVLFCICERLANVLTVADTSLLDRARQGPRKGTSQPDFWMSSRVRAIQLLIPLPAGIPALDLIQDVPPRVAERARIMFGMAQSDYDSLLEILGTYNVRIDWEKDFAGLLLPLEKAALRELISRNRGFISG